MAKNPEPKPHTRKKGNSCDGKRKSKAATMFVVATTATAAALHIIYDPEGQRGQQKEGKMKKCSKSCFWSRRKIEIV